MCHCRSTAGLCWSLHRTTDSKRRVTFKDVPWSVNVRLPAAIEDIDTVEYTLPDCVVAFTIPVRRLLCQHGGVLFSCLIASPGRVLPSRSAALRMWVVAVLERGNGV